MTGKFYRVYLEGVERLQCELLFLPCQDDILRLIDLKIKSKTKNAGLKQMVSLGMPDVLDKEGNYVKDYYFGGRNIGKLVISVRNAYTHGDVSSLPKSIT